MIPYFEIPALRLPGGFVVEPFGALVVTAVAVGWAFAVSRGRGEGIPTGEMAIATWWTIAIGLVTAHLAEIALYRPELVAEQGLAAFYRSGLGLSAIGGFAGATATAIVIRRAAGQPAFPFIDCVVEGLVVGWIFGRLGCAIVHDHPGITTSFFLAVRFPDGPRHDLGLYEFLFTLLVLFPVMLAVHRRRPAPGRKTAILVLIYAPVRFGLDFLRATDLPLSDTRYWGLTPAQYGCLLLIGVGVWLWLRPPGDGRRGPGDRDRAAAGAG